MKFLLSIYGNAELWSSFEPDEFERLVAGTDAHNKEMADAGELLFACGVAEIGDVQQVHVDDAGTTVVTDGPYLETKEYLGSFYIVDCESIERARELAAGMPSARFTRIEVWPIHHGGDADDLTSCQ